MRLNAPASAMDRCRRWNANVGLGVYVHVLDPKRPWTGQTQSLAFIDDDDNVVARVLRSNPRETLVLLTSQLRPIGSLFTG